MAYAKALFLFLRLLLLMNLLSVSVCDDAAVMFKLLAALSPTPSGWSNATHPCLWDNVSCESRNVVTINIYSQTQSISGELPSELTHLASLQTLYAQQNSLSGRLPSFANMSRLERLYLHSNQFSSIPQDFLLGLTNLKIFTGLSGTIDVLSSMTQLSQVWLQANAFTGPIPDLSECLNLFDLQLRDNQLTGVVPVSITALPKLVNITLQNNNLQGPKPEFGINVKKNLGNAFCKYTPGPCDPQVTALLAVAGGLGYPITLAQSWKGNNACNNWTSISCDAKGNVITVNLEKQHFSGTISPALANLTSLRNLYLNDNNLTGPIPKILTTLPNLVVLEVSNNNLSGPIPVFPPSVKFSYSGNLFLGKNVSTGGGSPGSGQNSDAPIPSVNPLSDNSNGSSISDKAIIDYYKANLIIYIDVFPTATGRATNKVDVYAFGVVLMEIITGKKAVDETLPDETCHLVTWFNKIIRKGHNLKNTIDPTLDLDDQTFESISKVAELASHCTANKYFRRPNMEHVVNVLGPFAQKWKPLRPEEIEEMYGGFDLHMSLPLAFEDSSIESLSFTEAQLNRYRLNQSAQF
nr:receptor-like kinase TMK4 [Ipomoea trifida]